VPLAETTFVNPDAPPEMFEVKSDKIDVLTIKRDGIEAVSAPRKELSVRSKKPKPGERASKGDGSIILVCRHLLFIDAALANHHRLQTQNNAYTVSKLPALPDRLRADPQSKGQSNANLAGGFNLGPRLLNTSKDRQHGAVYSSSGYALTITHTHAYVCHTLQRQRHPRPSPSRSPTRRNTPRTPSHSGLSLHQRPPQKNRVSSS